MRQAPSLESRIILVDEYNIKRKHGKYTSPNAASGGSFGSPVTLFLYFSIVRANVTCISSKVLPF